MRDRDRPDARTAHAVEPLWHASATYHWNYPVTRRGRNERYANASSRYPSAASASQRARKAGWPPL